MAVSKITADRIREAVKTCENMRQITLALNVSATNNNYRRIETVANEAGIPLPALNSTGKRGSRPDKRTSPAWNEAALREAVVSSSTLREVAEKLGVSITRRNRQDNTIFAAATEYGVELPETFSQMNLQYLENKYANTAARIFVKRIDGKRTDGQTLKRVLLRLELILNECSECHIPDEWNGKPISLQIEHINGDATDNRVENLTLLCPNCHSQTDTFGGRNKGNGTEGKAENVLS